MRRPLRLPLLMALCAALAACAQAPQNDGPDITESGTPAARMAIVFAHVSAANFVAENCRSAGIRARYGTVSEAIDRLSEDLVAEGYAEADLAEARRSLVSMPTNLFAQLAIGYLSGRGARRGDIASVCEVGRSEIAQNTAVGSLLRLAG